jgi:hypothetical protein
LLPVQNWSMVWYTRLSFLGLRVWPARLGVACVCPGIKGKYKIVYSVSLMAMWINIYCQKTCVRR